MSELQVASGVSSGSLARAAGAAAAVPGFSATSDGLGQSLLFFYDLERLYQSDSSRLILTYLTPNT